MSEERFYKAELRSIDAWRESEGGWNWNASYLLEDGLFFSETSLTPRKVFKALRDWGYLSEGSKGRVRLDDAWPILEIQDRNTYEPVFALMFNEEEY